MRPSSTTDENDIDLVMDTHGRRGIVRFLLGSVAERVFRLSETPVLAVRRRTSSNPEPRIDESEASEHDA